MLSLCPQHLVEDHCYVDALERAWQRLKAQHAAHCKRADCVVDDQHVTIVHGNAGVTADTVYWWKAQRWL